MKIIKTQNAKGEYVIGVFLNISPYWKLFAVKIIGVISVEFLALLTILRGVLEIPTPYCLNYGETHMLVNAWGITMGHGLYRLSELSSLPVFYAGYTPIIFLLVALGIKIWGVSYAPGRLIVLLCAIGCSIMVAGISRRRGADLSSAAMGGIVFLATLPLYVWGGLLRVDVPAAFLQLAAVFVILAPNVTLWRATAFVILAVAAGYTKQTAFGMVTGCLLGLMLENRGAKMKQFFLIGIAYAIGAAVVFLTMQLVTGGSFDDFVIDQFSYSFHRDVFSNAVGAVLSDPITFAVIILGISCIVFSKQRLWALFFMGIPLLKVLRTVSVEGSSTNHFAAPMAALSVGVALLLSSLKEKENKSLKLAWMTASVFLVLIICSLWSTPMRGEDLKIIWSNAPNKLNECKPPSSFTYAINFMKNNLPRGSLVLSQYPGLPLFADCVPVMSSPFTLRIKSEIGNWDPVPVVEALKNRKVALVVFQEQITTTQPMKFMSREIAEAVIENYEFAGTYERLSYYVPKNK